MSWEDVSYMEDKYTWCVRFLVDDFVPKHIMAVYTSFCVKTIETNRHHDHFLVNMSCISTCFG